MDILVSGGGGGKRKDTKLVLRVCIKKIPPPLKKIWIRHGTILKIKFHGKYSMLQRISIITVDSI